MSALKTLVLLCVLIYQVLHADGSPIQDPSITDRELSDEQHALLRLTASLHTAVNSFQDYFSHFHVTPKPGRNESNVVDTLPSTSTMKSTHLNPKQNPADDTPKPEKEDLASSENELEQEDNDPTMVQYIKGYHRRFVLSDESSSEEDTQKVSGDKAKIENQELASEEKLVDQKIVDARQHEDEQLPEDHKSDEQKLTEEQTSEIQKIIAEQQLDNQKIINEQKLEDQKIINEQKSEDENRVDDQNLEDREQQSKTTKKKQLNDQQIPIHSEDTNLQFEQVSDDQIDDKQRDAAGITKQTTEPTNKQDLAEGQESQGTSNVTAVYQTTENLEYPIRRSEQNKQPETSDGTTTQRIEANYEHSTGQSHHVEHTLKGETDSSQIGVTTVHLERASKDLGGVDQTEIVYLAHQTNPGNSAERTAAETVNKQDEQNNNAEKINTEATVAPSLYQTAHVQTASKLVVPEFGESTNPAPIADITPCDAGSEPLEENNNPVYHRRNFDGLEETPTNSAKTIQQQSNESSVSIGDEKMPQYLDGNISLNDNLKTDEHLEEIQHQQSADVKVPQYLDENVVFDDNPKTRKQFEPSAVSWYSEDSSTLTTDYQTEETTVNVDKLKTSTQIPHRDRHADLKPELTRANTPQLGKVDAADEIEKTDRESSEDQTRRHIIDGIISEISKEESAEEEDKLENATTKKDQEEGDSEIKKQSTIDKSAENENKQALELKTFVLEQLTKNADEPLKTILLEQTAEDEESDDKSLENEEEEDEEQTDNIKQNTKLAERKQAESYSDEDDISNQSAFVRMDLSKVKSDERNNDDDDTSTDVDYHDDDQSSYDKVHIVDLGDEYEPVQRIEIQRTRKQKERKLTSLERNLVQQLVNIILAVNRAKNKVPTKRYVVHNPSARHHGSSAEMSMTDSPLRLQKPVTVQKV